MTKRTNVERTIESPNASIIPYHITFMHFVEQKVKNHFKTDDIDGVIGNSIKWLGVEVPWTKLGHDLQRDEFGVVWKTNPYNRGNVVDHPLKEPDINKLQRPKYPYEDLFADLPEQLRKDGDYYHISWVGDLFERAHILRGMEETFMDFYLNPRFVKDLFEVLTDIILNNIRALKEYDVPGVFLSDDYGGQKGLLISNSMWTEFIRPCLRKIVDTAHECGKKFFLHSDGDVTELLPDFIELGIDVLHPVQSEVMDFKKLKQEYGRDICFYGGLGTQTSMLQTTEDLREEIRSLLTLKDSPNSFILAPTLQLMEDVPFENVIALIEEVQNV
jgi:uroporphyrinogen decarboxylase